MTVLSITIQAPTNSNIDSKSKMLPTMPKLSKFQFLLITLFTVFVIIRVWDFPNIPVGLNQDELSSLIEAKSLLQGGADKWGNLLPAYFPAFGSGQNVLLSYLTVPFLAVFGSSIFTVRIVSVLLGILALPLSYWLGKNLANRETGLVALLLVGLSPWHIIASRWGLESNMIPIWILIGLCTIVKALQTNDKKWITISLIPLVLSIYGYGVGIVIIPILVGLFLLTYHKVIFANLNKWLVGFVSAFVVFFPIGFWVFKNYISKVNYGFEKLLPFTAQLLPITRLQEVGGTGSKIFDGNFNFLYQGLNDGLPWNTNPGFDNIPKFLFFFFILGLVTIVFQSFNKANSAKVDFKIVFYWIIASLPLIWLVPFNTNRANTFFLPILLISSFGITTIWSNIQVDNVKKIFAGTLLFVLLFSSFTFVSSYFTDYKERSFFPTDLEPAFSELKALNRKTIVTSAIPLNYLFVLFYTDKNMKDFQAESVRTGMNKTYNVRNIDSYYMDFDYLQTQLQPGENYSFISTLSEKPCNSSSENITFTNKYWKVGICR
jgi:4-amino-4-deoxy-L-arabinose transferase-like glycosyltransferase